MQGSSMEFSGLDGSGNGAPQTLEESCNICFYTTQMPA